MWIQKKDSKEGFKRRIQKKDSKEGFKKLGSPILDLAFLDVEPGNYFAKEVI